ncbi:flagellar protein FlhE [Salmonella enterica]
MKCALWLALPLLVMPAAAQEKGGAWSRTATGGRITLGQQLLIGHLIKAPASTPRSATITRFSWRIKLLSPPPPGLEIKLCRSDKCYQLPALSGSQSVKFPLSPAGEFRFIYNVNSLGQLHPALHVVSNQLTVNYR